MRVTRVRVVIAYSYSAQTTVWENDPCLYGIILNTAKGPKKFTNLFSI